MATSLAPIKVLIINENIREDEDLNGRSPALAIKEGLEDIFRQITDEASFIFEALTIIGTPKAALEKLAEFNPDVVVIECSGLLKVEFDDFIDQLLASVDKPKEIIPINIPIHYHFDMLVSAQKRKLMYTEQRGDSLSKLIDILENIHKTYNKSEKNLNR